MRRAFEDPRNLTQIREPKPNLKWGHWWGQSRKFRNITIKTMAVGGGGGIRTHGRLSPTAVFKTAALNHSATHPERGL